MRGKQILAAPGIAFDVGICRDDGFSRGPAAYVIHQGIDLGIAELGKSRHDPARAAMANGEFQKAIVYPVLEVG